MSDEPIVPDMNPDLLSESEDLSDDAADSDCSLSGQLYSLTVPADTEGMRTDCFLSQALPEMSRSRLQELIKEGMAVIGGKPVKSSRKLSAGEIITIRVPSPREPEIMPENIPLDILYEDEDVIVVNKPKGMVVHPAAGHYTGTLVNGKLDIFNGDPEDIWSCEYVYEKQ